MKIMWLDAAQSLMMWPHEPRGDTILISGSDLSEFRKWLDGDLLKTIVCQIEYISQDENNSHEIIKMKFIESEFDKRINSKIRQDIMSIKTTWQGVGHASWSKGLPISEI